MGARTTPANTAPMPTTAKAPIASAEWWNTITSRAQHEQLSSRASEIAHLKLLLDKLQRMLFGAKGEKLVRQVAQLELQLEELETSRGEEEGSATLPFHELAKEEPKQPCRRTLPEHLPREVENASP